MTKTDALAQFDAALTQLATAQTEIDARFVDLFATLNNFYNAIVQINTAQTVIVTALRDLAIATEEAPTNE